MKLLEEQGTTGASLLAGLPSSGNFTKVAPGSAIVGPPPRVYICVHDTNPPEDQRVKTDATNILIRALTLKKEKKAKEKLAKVEDTKGKRPADSSFEDKAPHKRQNVLGMSTAGGLQTKKGGEGTPAACASSGGVGGGREHDQLAALTVESLKVMLREKGLPTKGRKDELVSRLLAESGKDTKGKRTT
eukprot:jgi/Mesvir1/19560/Mv07032-RA.1